MIAGSAALVLEAHPDLSVAEVKALLMNTAETNIVANPLVSPALAPIARIGAGEVRVDRALGASALAWDASGINPGAAGLSFGYVAFDTPAVRYLTKRVGIRNLTNTARTWNVNTTFRFADDQASNAIFFQSPGSVTVGPNSSTSFVLRMAVTPNRLPVWFDTSVNSGANAANSTLFQNVEYDGYLILMSGSETLSLPWYILPRQSHSGSAAPSVTFTGGTSQIFLSNAGASAPAPFEIFALTATSPQLPLSDFPVAGDSFQTVDLRAVGVRYFPESTPVVQFGVSSWDFRTAANTYPSIEVFIDANQDGRPEKILFNSETTAFTNAVFVCDVPATGAIACANTATGLFYTDVDFNSSNVILTATLSALGLTANQPFNFRVRGTDNYFTGDVKDITEWMTFRLDQPRYAAAGTSGNIPPGVSGFLSAAATANGSGSPSQNGFLILWRDGKPGAEASIVTVQP